MRMTDTISMVPMKFIITRLLQDASDDIRDVRMSKALYKQFSSISLPQTKLYVRKR
jgi:hypothetical protein